MCSNLTAINSTIYTSLSTRRRKFESDFVVATGLDLEILAWDCCRFCVSTNFSRYTSCETMSSVVLS